MYKVEIKNELNGREFGARFESEQDKNDWVNSQVSKQSWGKNERTIREEDMSEELRSRVLSSEEIPASEDQEGYTQHLVKADYVITETDLSQNVDFLNEQAIEARKKEYKSIEEVMHIILDHGLDSAEFATLQEERQAIKVKHAKQ